MTGPLGALLGLGIASGVLAFVQLMALLVSLDARYPVPSWMRWTIPVSVVVCAVLVGYVTGATS